MQHNSEVFLFGFLSGFWFGVAITIFVLEAL